MLVCFALPCSSLCGAALVGATVASPLTSSGKSACWFLSCYAFCSSIFVLVLASELAVKMCHLHTYELWCKCHRFGDKPRGAWNQNRNTAINVVMVDTAVYLCFVPMP